jgi:hypothetical protein
MAASQRTSFPRGAAILFPTRWLNAAARECGLVTRRPGPSLLDPRPRLRGRTPPCLASLRRFFQASSGGAPG